MSSKHNIFPSKIFFSISACSSISASVRSSNLLSIDLRTVESASISYLQLSSLLIKYFLNSLSILSSLFKFLLNLGLNKELSPFLILKLRFLGSFRKELISSSQRGEFSLSKTHFLNFPQGKVSQGFSIWHCPSLNVLFTLSQTHSKPPSKL